MHRAVLTTNFGENLIRHTVRIEDDPSNEGDFRALATMLQNIAMYQPDLLRHASTCPESLHVFYESGKWVLESVNIVPRPIVEE